jgi:hypothetical protein
MPDPIPRNRSARGRRTRRLMRPRSWRGGPLRRTADNADDAAPFAPRCTVEGPPLHLDQPLRRTHSIVRPTPPLPAPPPPVTPAPPPLPPATPAAEPPEGANQTWPPAVPRSPARPARQRHRLVGPPRGVIGRVHPTRPRRAGTDATIGVSILSGIALVVGLLLPLLPLGAPASSTSKPPAIDRPGGAAPAPESRDPIPVIGPPAARPEAASGATRDSTHNQVTLLADRTMPGAQVTTGQPSPASLVTSPIGPARVADPGRRAGPATVDQGQSNAGQLDQARGKSWRRNGNTDSGGTPFPGPSAGNPRPPTSPPAGGGGTYGGPSAGGGTTWRPRPRRRHYRRQQDRTWLV